jgi:TolB-like protein
MQLMFDDCVLDLARHELQKCNTLIHMRSKVFTLLSFLVMNRDRMVSRNELLDHCWPSVVISDSTLSSCIKDVRDAIGDDGDDIDKPRLIRTFRGQGFRFIATVRQHNEEEKSESLQSGERTPSVLPGRTRSEEVAISVLPFGVLDENQQLGFLADGLAEDITTELSRFKLLTVIARNSSFQYRGLANDIQKIRRELRVDYVLEGSVRRIANTLRASVQLIHAESEKHVWAESFDWEFGKTLDPQDEIITQIVSCIAPEISFEEFRRTSKVPIKDMNALELAWKSRELLDRSRSEAKPELHVEGLALAEQAVLLDPGCTYAWYVISLANYTLAFANATKAKSLLHRAQEAADKLHALDRNDHRASLSLGWISYLRGDKTGARNYFDHSHSLNPNCCMTLTMLGIVATSMGEPSKGYEHIRQAIRLSPRDLWLGFMHGAQALACFALNRFDEGVHGAQKAIQISPGAPMNNIILAACLVETNDIEGARRALKQQRTLNLAYLEETLDGRRRPFSDDLTSKRYIAAIRSAETTAS